MSGWIEKAEDEICEALNNGEITEREYNQQMDELMAEVRQGAEQAADEARDEYYR